MKHVILDTDPGVDDVMALALALASSDLKIEALTTVSGNAAVEQCARNCQLVVEFLHPENPPPVALGATQPLVRPPLTAHEVHGPDGIGGITQLHLPDGLRKYPEPTLSLDPRPAPQLIVDLARDLGERLSLVTLGPLTNIAQAIDLDRSAMRNIGEIIVMGGAFKVYGNTSLVAEFNIFVDPEAAQMTVGLGAPLTIIPLDVTEQVRLMRGRIDSRLEAAPSAVLELVRDVSAFYMDYHREHDGFDGCYMHDPLTVGMAIDHSFIRTVPTVVAVETTGELTRGMTLAELRPGRLPELPNAEVAVEVDAERFIDFFLSRLQETMKNAK
ncbi:MAG: nucleoside hydrolase [Armatimonadetes bacterium]|nr:nucleoside hydrolase [Armatimonadota bacterium]